MYWLALKMLFGDTTKFLTLVIGLTFAVLLIGQQGSIFSGLMLRTGSNIFETNAPFWVMEERVPAFDTGIPMKDSKLLAVRSLEGVDWAVPLSMSSVTAQSDEGHTAIIRLVGVDAESLIGLPNLAEGELKDLNSPNAVIITNDRKERYGAPKVGEYFEINDRRAHVVGVADSQRSFSPFPVVYTTYNRAKFFLPPRQRYMTFILMKPHEGVSEAVIKQRVKEETGLKALTLWDFVWLTMQFWAKNTGIPINFGITIFLGVIVGAAISGQTLYTFVIENVKHFGVFKAMGISNGQLIRMVLLQSLVVGMLGFGLGIGGMSLFGLLNPANSQLAYYTPWQLIVITFVIVIGFCMLASLISLSRVLKVDPAIVFRG